MWQDYRRPGWRGWLLPLAILLTALEQIHIITSDPSWGSWLVPVIAITSAIAALLLIIARMLPRLRSSRQLFLPAIGLALVGLLLTSAVWSAMPGLNNIAADLPAAGPTQAGVGGGTGAGGLNVNTTLIHYLEANRDGAKYLVAVASSNEADALILATNQPVMALGGFSGSDPILTTSELAALVTQGTIRFFLIGGFGGGGGQSTLTSWITQHCASVSASQWQAGNTSNNSTGFGPGAGGNSQLYTCQSMSHP